MKKIGFRVLFLLLLCWLPAWAKAQNRPDLVIVAPFVVPTTVLGGAPYTMSAVIKNQGSNGSQFNCIGYYLSNDNVWDATDAYLGSSCQSLMYPGQSGTCSIMGTISILTPPGSYRLLLVADPLNAEQESDETNNVVSFALTVATGGAALPDLELWRPSLSFDAVPPGGSTGAFTFIFNRGPGSAGSYEIGYYLSADTVFSAGTDVFLGLVTGGGLSTPSGTIHSAPVLTVPATTAPGNYFLVLMADPRNVIVESNENNNSRALPLRVTGAVTAATSPFEKEGDVYPNPISRGSVLRVKLAGAGGNQPVQIRVYDALGRQVVREAVAQPNQVAHLATQELPVGIYLLHLTSATLHTTRRLVVE
ncbi:hypothetical protein AUC43_08115 [Hymenobacter sedentarius]|uniref:Secretion system C-terminal sorting domain-containing protein n=1 Tax=Hymenobacter sedentarius TaxID=1411621 RepID=A0A0U4C211_9BACT|nr:CARDB domain-containing protein [Hymenobacter sedentarius]ALW85058.1 hypothetical protein AUC43_08115 [Hymenobacter sedentarius]